MKREYCWKMSFAAHLGDQEAWFASGATRIKLSAVEFDLTTVVEEYPSLRDHIDHFNRHLAIVQLQETHTITQSMLAMNGDTVKINLKLYCHDADTCDYELEVSRAINSLLYQFYCTIWNCISNAASYLVTVVAPAS